MRKINTLSNSTYNSGESPLAKLGSPRDLTPEEMKEFRAKLKESFETILSRPRKRDFSNIYMGKLIP